MKAKGRFPRRRIETRLWLLAVAALLFSVMQLVAGPQPHRYICCPGGEMNAEVDAREESGVEENLAPDSQDELVDVQEDADEQTEPVSDVRHHQQRPMLLPVSLDVSGVRIPVKAERIFSHRQIDEFLQHETQGSAGADSGDSEEETAVDDTLIF